MSWGFSEMPNETSYDSYFTTPAGHVGITFIASSGDSGSVEYPSASPNVLSVGGTSLTLSSSGTYQSESAWSDSGGGYSQYEAEPSYQSSVQTTGLRSTPDVAFDADPNTGVQEYETDPGRERKVHGRRSAGPAWALRLGRGSSPSSTRGGHSLARGAWMVPPKPYRHSTRLPRLTSTRSPRRPPLSPGAVEIPASEGSEGSTRSEDSGASTALSGWSFSGWSDFGFSSGSSETSSGATANTSTGLGSPNGSSLINDLVASTTTTPLTTITGSGQSGSGSGTAPTSPTHPPHRPAATRNITTAPSTPRRSSAPKPTPRPSPGTVSSLRNRPATRPKGSRQ